MFKKRVIKGKFRLETDSDAPGSTQDDEPGTAVMEMKLEQSMRKKKLGSEFSSDGSVVMEKSGVKSKSSVQKSIEATLGSQFESRVEDGLSSTLAHEKIMEQYVNQKMGIQAVSGSISKTTQQSQDDELYRLPDEIKYVSAISNPVGIKEEDREVGGGDQFISLGIAEVSLPISFKLNNIEETDDTMNKIEAARRLKYGGKRVESLYPNSGVAAIPAIGTARFWNPSMSSFVQQVEKDKQKAIESKNATSGPGSNSEQKSNSATDSNDKPTDGKRRNHSSDDRAMNMFKSNQRNRK